MLSGKKIRYIVLSIICMTMIFAVAAGFWFCSSGIHIIGPFVHLETDAACWLYEPVKETVEEATTVYLSGYGYTWDIPFDNSQGGGVFHGSIQSEAFPIQDTHIIGCSAVDGGLRFSCLGGAFRMDAETGMVVSEFNRQAYVLWLARNGRFLMNVAKETSPLTIVCADSLEDVPQTYAELSKAFYKDLPPVTAPQ